MDLSQGGGYIQKVKSSSTAMATMDQSKAQS